MEKELKGFVEFEGRKFWVDLTGDKFEFEEVKSDGTRVPGKASDFMDVLASGKRVEE